MSKGLHKNSLREGEPNKWIFEDAQEYLDRRGFSIPWNDGDVFVDKDNIIVTVASILQWADKNPAPTNAPKTFRYQDRLYHTVLQFEDNGETFYVVKFYGKYHQWWHYEVLSALELALRTK